MTPNRKRGMRKLPQFIENRLNNVGTSFYAAVVRRVPLKQIQGGNFDHVGLTWSGGQVVVNSPCLVADRGRFSKINTLGQDVVRRDLPKTDKTITFINPRLFGIAGNRCKITQTRKVYVREHLPARKLDIETSVLLANDADIVVRFTVAHKFSPTDAGVEQDLLFALNLLQESAGGVNVFPSNATTQEYLGSIQVHWEILPPGSRDENIKLIMSGFHPRSELEREDLERRANERYDFFETLGPRHIIRGTGGLNGYMGAVIADDVVVFEHLTPGNGIYLLFEDWAIQSQRTKTELLTHAEAGKDFLRITHTGDWQVRVRNAVASRQH